MNKIKMLAMDFYEFRCPDNILQSILDEIPNIKFNKDPSNYSTGYYYHEELFAWIHECLAVVEKDLMSPTLKLEISNCWINKAIKLQKTHIHLHPQSIVSGVLYFSDEESGKTIFKAENPWYKVQLENFLQLTNEHTKLYNKQEIKPEKGKLILFPSSVLHEVGVHTGNNVRYTLAFNTFISGEFRNPNFSAITDYLNIKTTFPKIDKS